MMHDARRIVTYHSFMCLCRVTWVPRALRLDVSNTGYITKDDLKVVMGEDYEEEAVVKMMAVRLHIRIHRVCVRVGL